MHPVMRLLLRETGSIVVHAPPADVLDLLARRQEGHVVAPDRYESEGSAYVLRESEDGTRVFHVREERAAVAATSREREVLRRAVQADLFELARVFEVSR